MLTSLFSLLLALLALGFIIFIHELGHFWMARRCGMRVEAFGIGFGRPLLSFVHKDVKWNIGWLPFGGYVKIAGMEKEGGVDPKDIPDGFFGSSPISRILVAAAGPLANILLAFLLFFAVFLMGGRVKPFSEVTNRIGWVDPDSALAQSGVRPGDIILSYDNRPIRVSSDHLQAAMTAKDGLLIEGLKKTNNGYVPFKLPIKPYTYPKTANSGIRVSGVLAPANFLIWTPSAIQVKAVEDQTGISVEKGILKNSEILSSGIQPGDRIVWIDGEKVFSSMQLSSILNEQSVLVTLRRDHQILHLRVPFVTVSECKLSSALREEIADWQWAADLKTIKPSQLLILPYNLTGQAVVEEPIELLDHKLVSNLRPGDEIIGVQGVRVQNSVELIKVLQKRLAVIMVERKSLPEHISMKEASGFFDGKEDAAAFNEISKMIGTGQEGKGETAISGSYHLLSPIQLTAVDGAEGKKVWLLGLVGVSDMSVSYNPGPWETMEGATLDMKRTLTALFGGYLSPKWLSGPVGMVQIIQKQTASSIPDSVFWVGLISLYLALSNLLPLPVLDGGYILLALCELVTGKRLPAKALEKIVLVFTVALILLILFVTYHDLVRLVTGLF